MATPNSYPRDSFPARFFARLRSGLLIASQALLLIWLAASGYLAVLIAAEYLGA